ncbi:Uncharacterized protein T02_1157 [Trichinella nativa]|uniref:Integrase catalytic domain-containing protein n=1 Tax=Trichinella nativa TaxID=6335 RepID=A0A0V1LV99_9BILA|nr:Uncharacterized protein T02_1157 [Trichinella nativa]
MSVPVPTAAWDTLTVDLVGLFYSAPYGQWFALTLIDYCNKWPEVHLCHAVTTKVIVNFLEDVFSREGYSKEIVSNDGVQFTSQEFKSFLDRRPLNTVQRPCKQMEA